MCRKLKIPHIQKTPLELINEYGNVAGYKNQHKNHLRFYMLTINTLKGKLRKPPHYSGIEKSKTPRNKFIPWDERLVHKQNISQRTKEDTNEMKRHPVFTDWKT